MSNYPNIKINTCSENVVNVDYVDIDYSASQLYNVPTITVTIDGNVNAFLSNVTLTSARINFSAKYTGRVNYTVTSIK